MEDNDPRWFTWYKEKYGEPIFFMGNARSGSYEKYYFGFWCLPTPERNYKATKTLEKKDVEILI
jgi:hypothetical protein